MALTVLEPFLRDVSELTPRIEHTVELEGNLYTYRLLWADRLQRWRMDLLGADGEPIYRGRNLNIGEPWFIRRRAAAAPPGFFVLTEDVDTGRECGFEELGQRCVLCYLSSDDPAVAELFDRKGLIPAAVRDG